MIISTLMCGAVFSGRPDAEHFMVIVSDGFVSLMPGVTISAAQQAKDFGIRIAVVTVADYANVYLFKQIASHPYSKYSFIGNNFASLMKLEKSVAKLLCGEFLICMFMYFILLPST